MILKPTAGLAGYFNEVFMEVNLEPRLVPKPFTAEIIASEIPAAIRPYSMAVAAVSSARNMRRVFIILSSAGIPELSVKMTYRVPLYLWRTVGGDNRE